MNVGNEKSSELMKKSTAIYIGTSGWYYDHWKRVFYPGNLSTDNFLAYYVKHFHTVEINNSFYQLPPRETLRRWRDSVPAGFLFAVKASRYITHMKKLNDGEQTVPRFLRAIDVLDEHLGPILFQLPPRWNFNGRRLEKFLNLLPVTYRYAFEFRDPSWFTAEAYELLQSHQVAFCIYDLGGRQSPAEVTSTFMYIRLHGQEGSPEGAYTAEVLATWAGFIDATAQRGREVYCYFNNDQAGHAVRNAQQLQAMLG